MSSLLLLALAYVGVAGRQKKNAEQSAEQNAEQNAEQSEAECRAECRAECEAECRVEWRAGVQAIIDAGVYYNMRCPLDGEYKIGESWYETH